MNELTLAALTGKSVLLVEDEYLIANDVAQALKKCGANIVGPARRVRLALDLIEGERIDGAVLDINLGRERVYQVAEALRNRNIPFVFTTGYDESIIDQSYAGVPVCPKPNDKRVLL